MIIASSQRESTTMIDDNALIYAVSNGLRKKQFFWVTFFITFLIFVLKLSCFFWKLKVKVIRHLFELILIYEHIKMQQKR